MATSCSSFDGAKWIRAALYVVSIFMVIMFMTYSQFLYTTRDVIMVIFVHTSLLVVFISALQDSKNKIYSATLLTSIGLSLYSLTYILYHIEGLAVRRWFNTTHDLVVGVILIVLAYYAGIICFGKFVPVLVMVVMIYPFFGQHLPEPFTTNAYSIPRTIANLAIGIDQGIFTSPTRVMINYVYLFIVFGAVLGATGVRDFFYELGKWLFGRLISGPALIATINSALVGSVVGSALANITITGVYTIPAMKKAGYSPEEAGAIEVAASNGGQILPPVMGVIAFAMAGFAGVPYITIVGMAIIPALLYFMCIAVYAHLSALKNPRLRDRPIEEEKVDFQIIKYKAPSFILPLAVIIYLLLEGYSVNYVAFWAIISVLIVSVLVPAAFRPSFKDFLDGFVEGGVSGAKIGVIAAVVGLMLTTFTGSGLGIKLSIGIEAWSGGVLFVALLIIWAISVLLGMIGVAVVAYFTAAAFAVPVLVEMGLPYETAHFFIVFPAVFALMTPPIALVSIVAARIAEADYLKTSLEAVKVAIAAFILPFLFVYSPALLMQVGAGSSEFWLDISAAAIGLCAIQVASAGYLLHGMSLPERALSLVCAGLLIAYLPLDNITLYLGGMALLAVVIAVQIVKFKRSGKPLVAAN